MVDDEIVLSRDDAETACRRLSVVIVEVLLPLDFISRKIGILLFLNYPA